MRRRRTTSATTNWCSSKQPSDGECPLRSAAQEFGGHRCVGGSPARAGWIDALSPCLGPAPRSGVAGPLPTREIMVVVRRYGTCASEHSRPGGPSKLRRSSRRSSLMARTPRLMVNGRRLESLRIG
jgi:hypothetical protein